MEVDNDSLISEIEKRPAIWDMASSAYSNKITKKKAWEELVVIYSDATDSEEKKRNVGKHVLLLF